MQYYFDILPTTYFQDKKSAMKWLFNFGFTADDAKKHLKERELADDKNN